MMNITMAIVVAALAAVAVGLIAYYWEPIFRFLKKVWNWLKKVLGGVLLFAGLILQALGGGFRLIARKLLRKPGGQHVIEEKSTEISKEEAEKWLREHNQGLVTNSMTNKREADMTESIQRVSKLVEGFQQSGMI